MTKKSEQGLTVKKEKNFSEWYTQVIQKSEMGEYTKVSGAMVFRPNSYFICEKIQEYINEELKKINVKNVYFPSLIPESLLNKETEHVEGFTPEVAWVTHTGKRKLKERLAVRPTSETLMYDSYRKWIRSYKDLPLKLNQWCNIVRWEFKHPIPFLRTREFLWQEGHNVFATEKEADKDTKQMIDLYEKTYKELLAVPVLKGKKSEKEKFAGAVYTLSIETQLPNGKAIQCSTSHNLGQNFSKVFDINFLDKEKKKQYAWQTSWGLTTRSIGILIAMHGDNKGLVLPPKVSLIQIVIVPIIFGDNKKEILKKCGEIKNKLKSYRIYLDDRTEYKPGWKFNEWELKGAPIRIEIGPKDIQKKQVILVRRDTSKKEEVKISSLNKKIKKTLEDIHKNLLKKATLFLKNSIVKAKNESEINKVINNGKIAEIKWCGSKACEEDIKFKTKGAKSLNISKKIKGKCANCNKSAEFVAYFGKSY